MLREILDRIQKLKKSGFGGEINHIEVFSDENDFSLLDSSYRNLAASKCLNIPHQSQTLDIGHLFCYTTRELMKHGVFDDTHS